MQTIQGGSTERAPTAILYTRTTTLFCLTAPLVGALAPRGMAAHLIVGAVLLALTFRLSHGRWPMPDGGPAALAAAFLGLTWMSAAWSENPGGSMRQALETTYILAAGLVAGGALVPSKEAPVPHRELLPFRVCFIAAAALLLADLLLGLPVYNLLRGRLALADFPSLINRSLVVIAALSWPFAISLLAAGRGAVTGNFVIGGVFALTLVGESQSALIGMLAGLLVYCLAKHRLILARKVMAVALPACTAAMPLVASMIHALGASDWRFLPVSVRHRVLIWEHAADRIAERPVLGWGLDAARFMPKQGLALDEVNGIVDLMPLHPHNAYLQAWMELGIAAVLLWAAAYVLLVRRIATVEPSAQPMLLGALAATAAMLGTSYGAWQAWWMSTLVTSGLLCAIATRSLVAGAKGTPVPKPGMRGDAPPASSLFSGDRGATHPTPVER